MDYYAETIWSESGKPRTIASREYLMPINTNDGRTVYIGLKVPKELIDDAEAVVKDTEKMLDDTDGTYSWDGSLISVKGSVEPMDQKTEEIYRESLIDAGIEEDEIGLGSDCYFLPLVLTHNKIGGLTKGSLMLVGGFGILLLIAIIRIFYLAFSGGYQKQIHQYLVASANPALLEQQLDQFYETTESISSTRMGSLGILYVNGMESWFLAADDIVWAYKSVLRRKAYGLVTVNKQVSVRVLSASEGAKERCHTISVKNEKAAQELLEKIDHLFPYAMVGYTDEIEKAYEADPRAFHQEVIDARNAQMEGDAVAEPEHEAEAGNDLTELEEDALKLEENSDAEN